MHHGDIEERCALVLDMKIADDLDEARRSAGRSQRFDQRCLHATVGVWIDVFQSRQRIRNEGTGEAVETRNLNQSLGFRGTVGQEIEGAQVAWLFLGGDAGALDNLPQVIGALRAADAPDDVAAGGCVPIATDGAEPCVEAFVLAARGSDSEGLEIPAVLSIMLLRQRRPKLADIFRAAQGDGDLAADLRRVFEERAMRYLVSLPGR